MFEQFPEKKICPLCGTNEDKPCILAAINGTKDGYNWEAEVIHTDCVTTDLFYDRDIGIVYKRIKEQT